MSEENIVQNTENESTISQDSETQQETGTEENTAAEPQEQSSENTPTASDGEGSGAVPAETDPPSPFLTVKYNHKEKGLSEREAAIWAQKGMYYESMHDKLDYIAAQSDMSVDTLIDNIMQSLDNSKLAELREKFGDDEETVNDLMTLYRNQQKEKYDKALADRKVAEEYREQTENARLADEFIAMKKTFPELTDFASLPAEVKKAAIGGNSLEHAYLKYQHSEKQKITAAKEAAKAAAEISAGPMSGESDSKTENESRFLRALWGN